MDEFQVEVETLEHNFWQLLNITKRLLARNEVLKAKLNEQTQEFQWRLREIEKENEDFRRKNLLLQKKLSAYECDDLSVVSKDYQEVLLATGNQSELQPSNHQLLQEGSRNEIDRDFEDTARGQSDSETPLEEMEAVHLHDLGKQEVRSYSEYNSAKMNYVAVYSESSEEENHIETSHHSNLPRASKTPSTSERPVSVQLPPKPMDTSSSRSMQRSKGNIQNPPVSNEESYSDSNESYQYEEPSSSRLQNRNSSKSYQDSKSGAESKSYQESKSGAESQSYQESESYEESEHSEHSEQESEEESMEGSSVDEDD